MWKIFLEIVGRITSAHKLVIVGIVQNQEPVPSVFGTQMVADECLDVLVFRFLKSQFGGNSLVGLLEAAHAQGRHPEDGAARFIFLCPMSKRVGDLCLSYAAKTIECHRREFFVKQKTLETLKNVATSNKIAVSLKWEMQMSDVFIC